MEDKQSDKAHDDFEPVLSDEEMKRQKEETNTLLASVGLDKPDENGRPLWHQITAETVEIVKEIDGVDISHLEGKYWLVAGVGRWGEDVVPSNNMNQILKRLAEIRQKDNSTQNGDGD